MNKNLFQCGIVCLFKYKNRLLEHMRISGTEPSSEILSKTFEKSDSPNNDQNSLQLHKASWTDK